MYVGSPQTLWNEPGQFQDIFKDNFWLSMLAYANAARARQLHLLLKLTRTILIQYSVVIVRSQLIDITHQLNNNHITEFT